MPARGSGGGGGRSGSGSSGSRSGGGGGSRAVTTSSTIGYAVSIPKSYGGGGNRSATTSRSGYAVSIPKTYGSGGGGGRSGAVSKSSGARSGGSSGKSSSGYINMQRGASQVSHGGRSAKSTHSGYTVAWNESGGRAGSHSGGGAKVTYEHKTVTDTTRARIPNPALKRPGPTIVERQIVTNSKSTTVKKY